MGSILSKAGVLGGVLVLGALSGCKATTPKLLSLAPAEPTAAASPVPSPPQPSGPSLSERIGAARAVATSDSLCTGLGDFYWEVGDASGTLGGGSMGATYSASTEMGIASASKIVFGAYLVEATGGALTARQSAALRMLSGYIGLNPAICSPAPTVQACLDAGRPGPNYEFAPAEVGLFDYDGAHDQVLASSAAAQDGLGWADLTTPELNDTIMPVLGTPGFRYAFPQFAGGVTASAQQFARFLSAIVSKKLLISKLLGQEPVCTLPGVCATAVASPAPVNWHYSYNHWVEDDPTGDGAFSSPGAFGFYPWISADKRLYGIVARESRSPTLGQPPYWASVLCGKKIRAAWMAGKAP